MTRSLASAVLLLALAAPAAAQPGRVGRPFVPPKDANFELFRGLLHFYGIAPVSTDELDALADRDFDKVIVVILGCSERDGGTRGYEKYTRTAVRNGGAVLIASDRHIKLGDYFADNSDVSVSGNPTAPRRRDDCYAGDPNFPFVKPQILRPNDPPLAALWENRPRVAANRPSTLVVADLGSRLNQIVAHSPANAAGFLHAFAAGGAGGERNPYRALVLADPDLLSNKMLYSSGIPDQTGLGLDNWGFALALAKDFLRDPAGRTKCLFVENGETIPKFDEVELKSIQNMPQVPLPNPLDRRVQQELAELLDGGVSTLEDRKVEDKLLAGPAGDPSQRRFQTAMMVLAAAAGAALVGLMARRLFAARHRKSFVPPPTDPLFLGDETALGSFGQRRAELLRGTDFRRPVAHRVRALFAARGLPAGYDRRRLPPLEFRGRSDRERLGRDIRALWDAATRDEAVPLPYAEWKELEPVLAEAHAAAAADRWRFAQTPPQGPA